MMKLFTICSETNELVNPETSKTLALTHDPSGACFYSDLACHQQCFGKISSTKVLKTTVSTVECEAG